MVVDGESGFLFEPLSPDDLAERLARLAYDPALLHDMSAAARRVAEEKFDLNQNIRRLIDVFQSEINPQGA
jgi:glycosyltransferase involved in cell wall biosynthesis